MSYEFPELRERIHALKLDDHHFKRLFDEYHELTRDNEKMEDEVTPVTTRTEQVSKKRLLHLKDELYRMFTAAASEQGTGDSLREA
jgi:uncharacterized protein YdcH (DUF465 family)